MNVPLDYIINIILRRIYDDSELFTYKRQMEMKELLLVCTKKYILLLTTTKYTNNMMVQRCDHI